jgi:hypothetical protein
MSKQIIKQPNGKYCVFSSISDNIIGYNCDREEIIAWFVKEQKEKITKSINDICNSLDNGERPYLQFTENFEEMLETIRIMHGQKEVDKILELMESKT